jgi:hypothetical protein
VPISRGGSPDEWILVCNVCNDRKGALHGVEYLSLLNLIQTWSAESRIDVLRRLRAGSKALRRMFAKGGA